MSTSGFDTATAAARRRQRRLRAYLRYAWMSVATALAERSRGPGPGSGYEIYYTAKFRAIPPPSRSSSSWRFCLGELRGPQEKVQHCIVEQLADVVPMVQILDNPVVLVGDRVMEVLRKLDVPSVEQVIAVPEISFNWVPQRSAARRPQTAEQLVEVPTERGYVFAIIATKALGWRRAGALAEQLVATPVPQGRRRGSGGRSPSHRMSSCE